MSPTDQQDAGAATAASDEARRPVSRLLLWMLTVAAAGFTCAVYLNWDSVGYPVVEPIRARIAERLQEREFARRFAMDPAPGTRLPDPPRSADPAPGAHRSDRACVVLFAGDLGCCVQGLHEAAQRLDQIASHETHRRARAVLVFHGGAEALRDFVWRYRPAYPVAADADGQLANAYNAFWTPRTYVMVDGRLRWIQKPGRIDYDAITRSLRNAVPPDAERAAQGATGPDARLLATEVASKPSPGKRWNNP
jgi:hypothetical protein